MSEKINQVKDELFVLFSKRQFVCQVIGVYNGNKNYYYVNGYNEFYVEFMDMERSSET